MARRSVAFFAATLLGVSLGACGVVAGLDDLGASATDGADATVDAGRDDGQSAPRADGAPGTDGAPGDAGSPPTDGEAASDADDADAAMCAETGAACPARACCAPLVCHADGGCGTCASTSGAKCYTSTDCCAGLAPPLFCQRDHTCTATVCIAQGSTGCSTSQDNCCVGSFCAPLAVGTCLKCVSTQGLCGSDNQCCSGSCKNNRCEPG